MNNINEMMWITFADENFQQKWSPLQHEDGTQVHWDSDIEDVIMDFTRESFPNVKWGIANTSQMLLGNAMRDNF